MKLTEEELKEIILEVVEETTNYSSAGTIAGTILKDVYSTKDVKLLLNKADVTKYIKLYNDPQYTARLNKIGDDFVKKLIKYNKDNIDEDYARDILSALGGLAGFVDVLSKEKLRMKTIVETLKDVQGGTPITNDEENGEEGEDTETKDEAESEEDWEEFMNE